MHTAPNLHRQEKITSKNFKSPNSKFTINTAPFQAKHSNTRHTTTQITRCNKQPTHIHKGKHKQTF